MRCVGPPPPFLSLLGSLMRLFRGDCMFVPPPSFLSNGIPPTHSPLPAPPFLSPFFSPFLSGSSPSLGERHFHGMRKWHGIRFQFEITDPGPTAPHRPLRLCLVKTSTRRSYLHGKLAKAESLLFVLLLPLLRLSDRPTAAGLPRIPLAARHA